jgi:hypothetical protein
MADAAPMNEGPWSDDEAEQVGESRSGDDDAAPVDEDRFIDDVPHVYDTHSSEETATMDPRPRQEASKTQRRRSSARTSKPGSRDCGRHRQSWPPAQP